MCFKKATGNVTQVLQIWATLTSKWWAVNVKLLPWCQWWPDSNQCGGGLVGQPMGGFLYYVVTWNISPYPMRFPKREAGAWESRDARVPIHFKIHFATLDVEWSTLLLPSWDYSTCKWLVWTSLFGKASEQVRAVGCKEYIWYVT